jgi:hypothetical protein
MRSALGVAGDFRLEYVPPDGTPGWAADVPNGPTTEGLNYLLNAAFRGGTPVAQWFLGLVDNSGFVRVAAADTHANHPGWAEFHQVYLGRRPAWDPLPAADGALGPNVQAEVLLVGAGTIRGAFLASRQPVGPVPGATLYCTAAAAAGLAVAAGGKVRVSYRLRARPVVVAAAAAVANSVVTYPDGVEAVATTGGSLAQQGETTGAVTYANGVAAGQQYNGLPATSHLVLYAGGASAAGVPTDRVVVTYANALGVGGRPTLLVDGRADLLDTGRYRR